MNPLLRLFYVLVTVCCLGAVIGTRSDAPATVTTAGCGATAGQVVVTQVPNDVLQDISCATAEILQGVTDVLGIIEHCGPLLFSQVIALIDGLTTAGASDAGAVVLLKANQAVHIPHIVLLDTQKARLGQLRAQAVTLATDAGR